MRAKWPAAGCIDETLLNSASYLNDVAHEFRTRQKSYLNVQKNKVADCKSTVKAVVTVAKTFPAWQKFILDSLQELYKVSCFF
jgi:hypothetical protein